MKLKILFLTILIQLINLSQTFAQCAMCRAAVSSNASDGGGIGVGLNRGILYLAVFPYLILAVIAYLWYKKSKNNYGKKKQNRGYSVG